MEKTAEQKAIDRILHKKLDVVINDPNICFCCKSKGLKADAIFCINCGFPQNGTNVAKRNFLRKLRKEETLLDEKTEQINKARNILFIPLCCF